MTARCPICKKPLETRNGAEARFRPFCSGRCKLIDLDHWLAGRYSIPSLSAESEEESGGAAWRGSFEDPFE